MEQLLKSRYINEQIQEGEHHLLEVEEEIFRMKTPFQDIEVLKIRNYGIGLFIDGRIQHVLRDEYVYSELMVHPAMFYNRNAHKQVLVLGGGPGGVVREVLKYNDVASVTQVDIDENIIQISDRYFKHIREHFIQDERYTCRIMDARDLLSEKTKAYDLIINDLNEPFVTDASNNMYSEPVFQLIKERLEKRNGCFVTWLGSANPSSSAFTLSLYKKLSGVFPFVHPYFIHTQTYGTSWLMAICSPSQINTEFSPEKIDGFLNQKEIHDLKIYDGITHSHIFNIPKDTRVLFKS